MSRHGEPYPDAKSFVQGLTSRAKVEAASTGKSVNRILREAYFDRFLVRVFSNPKSPWFVKGGAAMLAREPMARQTKDIDLATSDLDVDEAIQELQATVDVDAGDHLTMTITEGRPLVMPTATSSTRGARFTIRVTAGHKELAHSLPTARPDS